MTIPSTPAPEPGLTHMSRHDIVARAIREYLPHHLQHARVVDDLATRILLDLSLAAIGEPFGREGHYWQMHERNDFARWLRDRVSSRHVRG